MSEPLAIAWLTTGRGPGSFGALEYAINAIERGLPVRIAVVFVNRDEGEAEPTDRLVAFARDKGIAVETLSSVRFRRAMGGERSRPGEGLPAWRFAYDDEVAARLRRYRFDLGVMFGYMLIATPRLYEPFRFINDHPALPDGPAGTYQEVIAELMRTGAWESGCMMNTVTGEVDRGAPLSFCRFGIRDDANAALWQAYAADPTPVAMDHPLYDDIRARGVRRERPFLVETLRGLAEGQLSLPPSKTVDLTEAVEAALAKDEQASKA